MHFSENKSITPITTRPHFETMSDKRRTKSCSSLFETKIKMVRKSLPNVLSRHIQVDLKTIADDSEDPFMSDDDTDDDFVQILPPKQFRDILPPPLFRDNSPSESQVHIFRDTKLNFKILVLLFSIFLFRIKLIRNR